MATPRSAKQVEWCLRHLSSQPYSLVTKVVAEWTLYSRGKIVWPPGAQYRCISGSLINSGGINPRGCLSHYISSVSHRGQCYHCFPCHRKMSPQEGSALEKSLARWVGFGAGFTATVSACEVVGINTMTAKFLTLHVGWLCSVDCVFDTPALVWQ